MVEIRSPSSEVFAHLKLKSSFNVLLKSLSDGLIEIAQDLHGKLRVDALVADEIIEGICQSETNAAVNHVSQAVA